MWIAKIVEHIFSEWNSEMMLKIHCLRKGKAWGRGVSRGPCNRKRWKPEPFLQTDVWEWVASSSRGIWDSLVTPCLLAPIHLQIASSSQNAWVCMINVWLISLIGTSLSASSRTFLSWSNHWVVVRTLRVIYLALLPQMLINIYSYFLRHLFTSFSTSHKSHKEIFFLCDYCCPMLSALFSCF